MSQPNGLVDRWPLLSAVCRRCRLSTADSGPAQPAFSGWQVRGVSDEHTVLERTGEGTYLALGDKPLLIPGHIDPTVNLHNWIVAVHGDTVEAVWPIEARGAVF
jgi:D-serine deaminase-like pyridoxal phosphate-dependent protein